MTIPNWVQEAKGPKNIKRAANYLRDIDAVAAIEPLAQLSRRTPGWLGTFFAFFIGGVTSLALFALISVILIGAIWLLGRAAIGLVCYFYPDWGQALLIGLILLFGLWLWHDDRLRNLLYVKKFEITDKELTHVGLILLWPFRALAKTLRLSIALLFLTTTLMLPLACLPIIGTLWNLWQQQGGMKHDNLLTYGFVAAFLYLLFGLFIFGNWPRRTRTTRWRNLKKANWKQALMASIIAIMLGLTVWSISPTHRNWAGLASGIIYFLLWVRWFREWRFTDPFDFSWIKNVNCALTDKQIKFLKFNLFVLGVFGGTVITINVLWGWNIFNHSAFSDNLQNTLFPYVQDTELRVGTGVRIALGIYVLASIYPTGLAVRLAKFPAWPFFWLCRAINKLVVRVRANLAVHRAIKHHRVRNRKLVGKRGRQAVCKKHLARFKRRKARLSYQRRWIYWTCRMCQDDQHAIANIRNMQGVFDTEMDKRIRVDGDSLLVNLLDQIDNPPLDLQEVYVKRVENPYDIERFLVAYQNLKNPVEIPDLKRIRLLIAPEADLDLNIKRMLRDNFR
jgi:hypothetical protein